ncbi:hypothetical protein VOLCADRAFT_107244 [Volvox carteri f. nagariensis]|uniref:Amine oxidase domain-containing protein n=1 Tax=Volvox carteri f. nagariensis TaxID=3068 RepID=D8UCU1_VOLCA|nr:uncharacterized protein VOLCADRAFT_107244 [Volvox carteri f. nagariensis]EFJ42401.1 hypothetical protein VOLCADRAFT_107244 [Volvox carteri f. nagariensis]|eukprot:XP_002956464.1 hypothetical protein VOLCADRAFT_107244 [Volvox carteri f. nagariensis]
MGQAQVKQQPPKKRVLVVGAGAAGIACAWSLSRFPERFEVEVWEALSVPGGVASSHTVKDGQHVINDQVQGGAPSYRHNLRLLEMFGFKPTPVMMRIAFGVGRLQWTNHSPSELTALLQPEIARFGRVLTWIKRLEPLFVFVPIDRVLRLLRFSDEFRYQMVFPLVALFFGTGNQTPHVAAAVIARVFLDPDLRLFDYCPQRLLNSVPEMFAFPVLEEVWTTIARKSNFKLCCDRPLAKLVRQYAPPSGGSGSAAILATDAAGVSAAFDEVVFACDAETVLRTMANPTWLERRLLRNVRYYTDFCLTHEDHGYMARMYDIRPEQRDNYFVRTYPGRDRDKIEMSFNLSTYQPHLKVSMCAAGLDIYQTYYLDAKLRHLWSDSQVGPSKVLASRWMRQFAHTWTHFAFWVPWVRFIQGTKHTWYCGSYTMVNTQEIAVMSGLAAALRLGADYPFPDDPLAVKQFDTYLGVVHGVRGAGKPTTTMTTTRVSAPAFK